MLTKFGEIRKMEIPRALNGVNKLDLTRPHTTFPTLKSNNGSFPERSNKNPFFVRNNPHPAKVRHIKGLLDYPVCTVLDTGFDNPLPTNLQQRLLQSSKLGIFRKNEKFVPGIGIVNNQPEWVNELQNITQKVGRTFNQPPPVLYSKNFVSFQTNKGKSKNKPPPSRCLSTRQSDRAVISRGQSRQISRMRKAEDNFIRNSCDSVRKEERHKDDTMKINELTDGLTYFEHNESYVFQLLSQILQTSSTNDVKEWLTETSKKEKEVVVDMIRATSNYNSHKIQTESLDGHIQQPEYNSNLLHHKLGLSPHSLRESTDKHVNNLMSNVKENAQLLLDQMNESLDVDVQRSNKPSSMRTSLEVCLPQINEGHAQIEEIRTRLSSRGGPFNVFGRSTSR